MKVTVRVTRLAGAVREQWSVSVEMPNDTPGDVATEVATKIEEILAQRTTLTAPGSEGDG